MRKRLCRLLITVMVLGASFYGAAAGWLRLNASRLIYMPLVGGPGPAIESSPRAWQRVVVTAADGVRLVGIVLPADGEADLWLLDFHGNAGSVWSRLEYGAYDGFRALGLNVIAIDYRGYGESDPRTPDEAGLYADAQGAYDWLRHAQQVPAERLIIYGHSLGAGPATELALHVPAAALVLEGAFTSIPDLAAELYWWLPIRWIATDRFANVDRIGRVAIPKLLMHAVDDEVIPYEHGRRLFAAAREPKQWTDLSGGHNGARGPAWQAALDAFIHGLATR